MEWELVAINRADSRMEVFPLRNRPNSDAPPPETREQALEYVKAWQDYNEFWTYALVEDECFTPEMFKEQL